MPKTFIWHAQPSVRVLLHMALIAVLHITQLNLYERLKIEKL